jgi:hypothetical protein
LVAAANFLTPISVLILACATASSCAAHTAAVFARCSLPFFPYWPQDILQRVGRVRLIRGLQRVAEERLHHICEGLSAHRQLAETKAEDHSSQ